MSEGQDLQETRAYVADLVTRQMQLEGFRLQPEQALLTSARNALLSRLVLRGKAGQEATQRFVQLAFGRFANPAMVPQVRRARSASLLRTSPPSAPLPSVSAPSSACASDGVDHDAAAVQDQLHAAAHALLEDSGLLELESQVRPKGDVWVQCARASGLLLVGRERCHRASPRCTLLHL